MPIYVYYCEDCDKRSEFFFRTANAKVAVACESCGSAEVSRVFSPFSIYRSELTQLQQLDPMYFKKVDDAMKNTPEADPMRHLKRMQSFDSTPDPGEPLDW